MSVPEETPDWKTNSSTWWIGSAQKHARAGRLENWIHAYLATDGWNDALLEELRSHQRRWRGPVEAVLADLVRICGPEAHMEYRPEPAVWERNVTLLQEGFRDPLHVPPLIVEYRQGKMVISDGAHRHEAMRRLGWRTCWVVICYDTEEDFLQDGCRWTPLP